MVFLMQYLDDELCNQICGLLINIHMEDRSKEMEKKDVEKSGIFKTKGTNQPSSPFGSSRGNGEGDKSQQTKALNLAKDLKKEKSIETLLTSYNNSNYEEDLTIDENVTLGQYALQEITLEWLNWNAQFFDFSDEPYFFQLAEILSKDFSKDDTKLGLSDKTSLFFEEPQGGIGGGDSAFSLLSQAGISEPKDFMNKSGSPLLTQGSNKALGQRNLRSEYNLNHLTKLTF